MKRRSHASRALAKPETGRNDAREEARWPEPRRLAREFVEDRRPTRPERTLGVLDLIVPSRWGDLVGGSWIGDAGTMVYMHSVPGFSTGRTHQLIAKFVAWLHARGHLDDWQRRALLSRVDEARASYGAPREHAEKVRDVALGELQREQLGQRFAREVDDPVLRPLAPSLTRLLARVIEDQLGPCAAPPLGSLDPDQLITLVFALHEPHHRDADRALFTGAAAFYRWLGTSGQLDPERAKAIGARLAAAALGLVG